jgi:hypothetical protein
MHFMRNLVALPQLSTRQPAESLKLPQKEKMLSVRSTQGEMAL